MLVAFLFIMTQTNCPSLGAVSGRLSDGERFHSTELSPVLLRNSAPPNRPAFYEAATPNPLNL